MAEVQGILQKLTCLEDVFIIFLDEYVSSSLTDPILFYGSSKLHL